MKIKSIFIITIGVLFITACTDLNLNPLSEGSSESWYSSETEIDMALNDIYREVFWPVDYTEWTDDWTYREGTTPITSATINGEWGTVLDWWRNSYKCISRANTVLANLDKVSDILPQAKLDAFEGDARFVRAAQYSKLISHWGDVIYFTNVLGLEESFTLSKTDKATILQEIYSDFDAAAEKLPVSYGSSANKRATKGAALGMKARIALYMEDWSVARDAAQACMELGTYELYADFGELFLSKTKNTKESIFSIPRSVELDQFFGDTKNYITRNSGGWAAKDPSWDLLCSFLCTDGLPIDESPLFDPHEPFKNRDPRCSETIVEFQTPHLGYIYQPHPDSLNVLNLKTGSYQKNNDTRSNALYASFNGLVWKKGIDEDWSDDFKAENEIMILRFADVLLMYAEAKVELNEIDDSVLDAINQVRARAYQADYTNPSAYPAVTTTDQTELRKILRAERRMEFAFEGTRYMDIIRWRIAENVLNKDTYGMLDVDDLREKVVNPGLWFFPSTPDIDEDGAADFTPMYNAGLIKRLAQRDFDATKQYLWPIPTKEILINSNLEQNPGY